MTETTDTMLDTAAYLEALDFVRGLRAPGKPLGFPDYAQYIRLVAERVVIDLDAYEGELNDFRSNDDSTDYRKSKFLLAGLAGLGRVEAAAVTDFSETLKVNIRKESGWSRAITSAAQRGESGTVVLLSAAALQGAGWEDIPPHHLFHIVRALKKVGLDGEARMIAAEAVSWS